VRNFLGKFAELIEDTARRADVPGSTFSSARH